MKVALLALCAVSMVGCAFHLSSGTPGSGKLKTTTRSVKGFSKIDCQAAGDVRVRIGSPASVKVTIDDNLEKELLTNVEGSTLVISTKSSIDPTKLVIDVVVPKLEAFAIHGAADVDIAGLNGGSFLGEIHGAGDLKVAGSAERAAFAIHGAGDISAFKLTAQEATAEIHGAGSIELTAVKRLLGTIKGAGDITYKGDPKVTSSIDGAGSIDKG